LQPSRPEKHRKVICLYRGTDDFSVLPWGRLSCAQMSWSGAGSDQRPARTRVPLSRTGRSLGLPPFTSHSSVSMLLQTDPLRSGSSSAGHARGAPEASNRRPSSASRANVPQKLRPTTSAGFRRSGSRGSRLADRQAPVSLQFAEPVLHRLQSAEDGGGTSESTQRVPSPGTRSIASGISHDIQVAMPTLHRVHPQRASVADCICLSATGLASSTRGRVWGDPRCRGLWRTKMTSLASSSAKLRRSVFSCGVVPHSQDEECRPLLSGAN